jgi:hypothetical protein
LFTGVIVTGDKFIAGISDTGDHGKSVTPMNSLSPVLLTPVILEKIVNGPN